MRSFDEPELTVMSRATPVCRPGTHPFDRPAPLACREHVRSPGSLRRVGGALRLGALHIGEADVGADRTTQRTLRLWARHGRKNTDSGQARARREREANPRPQPVPDGTERSR